MIEDDLREEAEAEWAGGGGGGGGATYIFKVTNEILFVLIVCVLSVGLNDTLYRLSACAVRH